MAYTSVYKAVMDRLQTVLPKLTNNFHTEYTTPVTYASGNIIVPIGSLVNTDLLNIKETTVTCNVLSAEQNVFKDGVTHCVVFTFDTRVPFIFSKKEEKLKYITLKDKVTNQEVKYEVLDIDEFGKKVVVKLVEVPPNFLNLTYQGLFHQMQNVLRKNIDYTVVGSNIVIPYAYFDNYTQASMTFVVQTTIFFWARKAVNERKNELAVAPASRDKCILFLTPVQMSMNLELGQMRGRGNTLQSNHTDNLFYDYRFIIELTTTKRGANQAKAEVYEFLEESSHYVFNALNGFHPYDAAEKDLYPIVMLDLRTVEGGEDGAMGFVMEFAFTGRQITLQGYTDYSQLSNFNKLQFNSHSSAEKLAASDTLSTFDIQYKDYIRNL